MNLDTTAAIALVAEGSPERHRIKAFCQGKRIIMSQTALREFTNIVSTIAGPREAARAQRLLARITVVSDQPSPRARTLRRTNGISGADVIILGTGDQFGAINVTGDARAIRAAAAQGVVFQVFAHQSILLQGK